MNTLRLGTPECDRPGITRVITFVTDRGYLAQSLIAASQLAAQPEVVAIADIILYLIDIPDAEQSAIQTALGASRFNFRFLDSKRFLSDSVDRLPDLHVPHSTLGRLVLDAEIPPHYDTIIYMDGDIQIIGKVAALIAHDCAPGTVLAGCDRLDHGGKYGNPQYYLDGLGVAQPRDYFNAGIMMAPRAAWRTFTAAALDFLTRNPESCKHYDQSALNAAVGAHREWLPPEYNFTTWFQQADPAHATTSPRIVHFTGPLKPEFDQGAVGDAVSPRLQRFSGGIPLFCPISQNRRQQGCRSEIQQSLARPAGATEAQVAQGSGRTSSACGVAPPLPARRRADPARLTASFRPMPRSPGDRHGRRPWR